MWNKQHCRCSVPLKNGTSGTNGTALIMNELSLTKSCQYLK
jgi:hypothetical protein